MATCDFDMCFTFISLGWEGSAHDTRVFLHALNTQELNFPKPPEGKYYLVDKGYPDRKGYLVPYPKTRYHKDEFTNMPPTNEREAFNRSHSSLRSCIERSFGVLKKRWKILGQMPQFSVETQLDVIMAAFALHNYIRKNSTEDLIFRMVDENPDYMPCEELPDVIHARNNETSRETSKEMEKVRDDIASLIWKAQ
ncbi:protein ALP1-like [Beta vulgaris subsp. vulgaris]|uniref:protein ALP1-like n=1 Tax=Beta vulgaris subsp. vulgaris TaxID=3555 RepID=UPI00053F851F|nr:protein ALP1-like [Beta vulgaris subsp. vulgaris]